MDVADVRTGRRPQAPVVPHAPDAPRHPRPRPLITAAIATAILLGLVLRFVTTSDLWLDEALTVNVARLPLGDIAGALRHDGAPPLYYYLLHGWIQLFGEGDLAVRSLSAVFGVATLPVMWVAARRLGGRAVAWTAVVLLATAPFAIRYGTEARMYTLVTLLTLVGYLALVAVLESPTPWRLVGLAAVTGALLLTHYWAFYLGIATAVPLLVLARRGRERAQRPSRPARDGRRLAGLRPLVAGLPQPGPPHGHAVGRPRDLPGHGQRGRRVRGRRQRRGPGGGAADPGRRRARGVRAADRRPAHRARPPHPAPRPGSGVRDRRDPGHRHRGGAGDRQWLRLPLHGRGVRPLHPARRARHHRFRRPAGALRRDRGRGGVGPGGRSVEHHRPAHPGR